MLIIHRRNLLRGTAALGGAALLAGAAPGRARAADTITLYNGQHRATTEALVAAFTKATGIQVTVRNAESPELASQIVEEGARSPADLFFSEQSPPIASLQEKGLLGKVDEATLKTVGPPPSNFVQLTADQATQAAALLAAKWKAAIS